MRVDFQARETLFITIEPAAVLRLAAGIAEDGGFSAQLEGFQHVPEEFVDLRLFLHRLRQRVQRAVELIEEGRSLRNP